MRVVAALLSLLLLACNRPTADRQETSVVATSTRAEWRMIREGDEPAVATQDGFHVFFVGHYDAEARKLPGLTFGDARGPRYGLLAGEFAPLIAPIDSSGKYAVTVKIEGETVVATFANDLTRLVVRLSAPHLDRATVFVEGPAVFLAPADRAEVQTFVGERPSALFRVNASDAAKLEVKHADRLQVRAGRRGVISLAPACAQAAVITPVRRGSTSTFLVAVGTLPSARDPIFGTDLPTNSGPRLGEAESPGSPVDRARGGAETAVLDCASGTSTLSFQWPPK